MDKLLWHWFDENVHSRYEKVAKPSVKATYLEKVEESQDKVLST